MPELAPPTPLELIRLTTDYLAQRKVGTPRLDAEVLLAHVLHVPRIQLYVQYDQPLEKPEVDAYRELVRRRGQREPVAHLLGTREFWSLELEVDRRVLVPRPETERLVEACLESMGEVGCLADLGTGSGAIAVALLRERPQWTAVGVDCSAEALALAAVNAGKHDLEGRFELRRGDLMAPLGEERFDLIVSNPPYIPSAEIDGLEPEVARFDPRGALDGGGDGLDVIRRIVRDAPASLNEGGTLLLEFGAGQHGAVEGLLQEAGAYGEVDILEDYAGCPRVAVGKRLGSLEARKRGG